MSIDGIIETFDKEVEELTAIVDVAVRAPEEHIAHTATTGTG